MKVLRLNLAAAGATSMFLALTGYAAAQAPSTTAQADSMTPLWIMTISVIGLVILFFAIASMVSKRRASPNRPDSSVIAPTEAVAAVASLDKARSIAKAADQAQDTGPHS